MAEQRDVQALAARLAQFKRSEWIQRPDEPIYDDETGEHIGTLGGGRGRRVPRPEEWNELLDLADELVLEHTRQEEALRQIADPSYVGNYEDHEKLEIYRKWASHALSPPPVASGENAEEAQFTPEAWEKLTQQHQAFLARRSVASGTEGEDG